MKVYKDIYGDHKVDKISEKGLAEKEKALEKRLKHLRELRKNKSVPSDVLAKKWKDASAAMKRLQLRKNLYYGRNKKGHSGN